MHKLISINFMKNESHCVERMLDSVQPCVSESYVIIDDTTTDNTKEICESRGCYTKFFIFKNFGHAWNTLLDYTKGKSSWLISIAPDETIGLEFGDVIFKLITQIHDTDIDGVWFNRRHWLDLEKKEEYTEQNWYPDPQLRLIRNDYPRIHLTGYVHEKIFGLRKAIRVNKDIDHFNMYWKKYIDYDLYKMQMLYNEMQRKQHIDGGKDIWPQEGDLR